MRLGVAIPTLDEEADLPATLAALLAQSPDEVVVIDGGSRDRTREVAGPRVRVIDAPRGRARQLNAGAEALGDVDALLFLHADCVLGDGSLAELRSALEDPRVVGGAFHKRFRSRSWLVRHGGRARTLAWHALGYTFGDQAQFIRTEAFRRLGGFREDVAAEDMDLAWRMGVEGSTVLLGPVAEISARRLDRHGVVRTWLRWWSVALKQAAEATVEGPRPGGLSSEPRAFRGSSGTG